ncbi:MAG: hypothetical protein VX656_21140, partial [Candidatus Latescibacterota bacterium]|nr:hypothetical protein [Candidatus Latescibacterota bacterium]
SQPSITSAKSESVDTLGTLFGCAEVLWLCMSSAQFCESLDDAFLLNALNCTTFAEFCVDSAL